MKHDGVQGFYDVEYAASYETNYLASATSSANVLVAGEKKR